jgi:hypothetical protein
MTKRSDAIFRSRSKNWLGCLGCCVVGALFAYLAVLFGAPVLLEIAYGVIAAAWFLAGFRCARAGIFIAREGVVVRGVTGTRNLAWRNIVGAGLASGSIFNASSRVVGVKLSDGEVVGPSTLGTTENSQRGQYLVRQLARLLDEARPTAS